MKMAAEEVVADGMELILTDGKVLEELAREDKTLWEKTKKNPRMVPCLWDTSPVRRKQIRVHT